RRLPTPAGAIPSFISSPSARVEAAQAGENHEFHESMKHTILLILMCAPAVAARAQNTAFTYTGRLAANGGPYTGLAEMNFTLFDAPTAGVPLATNAPGAASVNVTAGVFSVLLDFGAGPFTGADRWLEIQVRTNTGAFSTLKARQALLPTPYALYALN